MSMSLFHLHRRKRLSGSTHHPYPAQNRFVRILDKVIYLAAFISLAMMAPQIWRIYSEKNADGFEPASWLTFSIMNIPWIIYGFVHKEMPIAITYTAWMFVNFAVFVATVLY